MNKYFVLTAYLLLYVFARAESTKQYEYADYLFQNQMYEMAIPEYYRAMYCGTTADTIRSLMSIARCYANTQHNIEALNTYKKVLLYDPLNWEASFGRVILLNKVRDYYESNVTITEIMDKFSGSKQDSLRLIQSINHVNLGQYNESYRILAEITSPDLKNQTTRIVKVLDRNLPLKTKSRMRAAVLQAVIPGSGYLYCGMPQTGLATFVVNALLGYAVYDNFHKGNKGSGLVFSIMAGGFYLGSVFGCMQTVSDYNSKLLENLSTQIYP